MRLVRLAFIPFVAALVLFASACGGSRATSTTVAEADGTSSVPIVAVTQTVPLATSTPSPTATPTLEVTVTPTPTNTPVPTSTPEATATPIPTPTPSPAGFRMVQGDGCRYAVPQNWADDPTTGLPVAPNDNGTVVIVPNSDFLGWELMKEGLKALYSPDTVIVDNDTRLLYEYKVQGEGTNYLSARNEGGDVCTLLVSVLLEELAPVARQIADSVAPD